MNDEEKDCLNCAYFVYSEEQKQLICCRKDCENYDKWEKL